MFPRTGGVPMVNHRSTGRWRIHVPLAMGLSFVNKSGTINLEFYQMPPRSMWFCLSGARLLLGCIDPCAREVEVLMRSVVFTAACSVMLAGSASAADLSRPSYFSPTVPLASYGWTGPYFGGNLGYEWGTTSSNPTRPSGFAGGLQGGYNWQTSQFVFGGEADLQLSGADDTVTPWKFSNPWFGTLRARGGVAVNNFLIYGTAGFAFGELEGQTVGLQSESHMNVGLTAGAG